MEGLRSHFDMTDSSRTPLAEETLRQFYSRTTEHWAKEVVAQWHAKQEQAATDGTINKVIGSVLIEFLFSYVKIISIRMRHFLRRKSRGKALLWPR